MPSKLGVVEHDAATFLDHTTGKTTEEDTSVKSDPVNTFNHKHTVEEHCGSLHDLSNEHLAFHIRGIAGTPHNKKHADEVDPV